MAVTGTPRPLDGMRVLDLTRLLPGGYCTWLLATLGADVLKVEPPGAGDYLRTLGHQVGGQSAIHHLVNAGKRSIVLDLKQPEGRAVLERLVCGADVLVESFRPGVLARLDLGADRLRALNPALVYVAVSSFGQDGPMARVAVHDINTMALSGLVERLGTADGPPVLPPIPLADVIGGGLLPALGTVALALRARATGIGGELDASIIEGVTQLPSLLVSDLLAGGAAPGRGRTEFAGQTPFYDIYPCADGHVAVGALEPPFWAQTCRTLGLERLIPVQGDPAAWGRIRQELGARLAELTRAEIEALFAGQDACVTPVLSYEEWFDSGQARVRGLVRTPDGAPRMLAPPFVVDGGRPAPPGTAPRHGEHSRDVLREAGYADAEIDRLADLGVIAVSSP